MHDIKKPHYYITDVFSNKKYAGNQLATFVDCDSLSSDEMLQISKEINYSETTFITSTQENKGGYDVRIFTPREEIEFAGHPTLGTAFVLLREVLSQKTNTGSAVDKVILNLPVGQIPVRHDVEADIYWMKQAAPQFARTWTAADMAEILSLDVHEIDTQWPICEVSTGFPHIIVPVVSLAVLKKVTLQKRRYLDAVTQAWAKNILVFTPEAYEPEQALAVRVFAGYYGIDEDAATGSGNGCLAAYLVQNNYFDSDSIDLQAGQGYELGRPSCLYLSACKTNATIEVHVGGAVCLVAQGRWL